MQFISVTFLIFLFLSFFVYFCVKKEYRYLILLVANYVFFGWNNLRSVPILLLATLVTYIGGLVLSKRKSKGVYGLFFALSLLILVFFKYSNFSNRSA
jgi:alginate O-acetyltransferase complex protein AlgI